MGNVFEEKEFIKTSDGSTGLYNKEVKDIYHSKTGAYSEALEKFINPIFLSGINFGDEVRILDICYGIGYNTKCAIDKLNVNLEADILETDKSLVLISPFIKDNIDNDSLKLSLISEIYKNEEDIKYGIELYKYFNEFGYDKFFSSLYSAFYSFYNNTGNTFALPCNNNSILHNIYYNYISDSMNKGVEINNNKKIKINTHIQDARITLQKINNSYDIIFLDAFSSKKDPTLWTIHFLNLIKQKMKPNSLLISYSKSTAFRSALIELGFNVGKTFLNNTDMGTVASFNKHLIINPLDDIDFKLIDSRSGITYKDPSLSLPPTQILLNRNSEIDISDRISRTKLSKIL